MKPFGYTDKFTQDQGISLADVAGMLSTMIEDESSRIEKLDYDSPAYKRYDKLNQAYQLMMEVVDEEPEDDGSEDEEEEDES